MKKRLLCLVLSMAMVFTTADSLVLAAERPTELQTAVGETQEETSASQEGVTKQPESGQEPVSEEESTESDQVEDTAADTETEKETTDSDEETTDSEEAADSDEEATDSGEATDSDEENMDSGETTDSVEETTEPETEETADSKAQSSEDRSGSEKNDTDSKLQVEYHSISEIIEFLDQEKADKADAVIYTERPDLTAPYQAGALSDTTLRSAAAMVRQIRFIAGLSYELQLNDEYNHISQAAALLNSANQELCQEPSRPEGMSEELFEQGRKGVSNSNLAYTGEQSQTLNGTIIETWMADQDEYSRRGRLLQPSLEQIGFGVVQDGNGMYSAMYTEDRSDKGATVFGVAWPAQNMPVDYFDRELPWSVSTGETLEASDIRVTLTREADGKEWTFSAEKSDGSFAVDNDDCGQSGCISFRPDTSDISEYADGDAFQVEITKDEKPYLKYRVRFFAYTKEEEETTAPEDGITDEDTPERYTVNFESNGGTVVPAQSIAENDKIILPEQPVKEGSFFDDWYQEEELENKWDFETDVVEADITLYAKWIGEEEEVVEPTEEATEADTAYSVTYDMQGIGEQIASETINEGEILTQPDIPVAEDYIFEAWYQEQECINLWDFETDVITQDTVLYAKWVQENETAESADDLPNTAAKEVRIDLSAELTDTRTNKIAPRVYNGKAYEPSVKVTAFNGKRRVTLKKNKDYKLQYANNVHAGEDKATVTISGMGKYTGSVTKTFTITPKSVKKLKIMTGSKLPGDKGVAIVIYDGTVRLNNGWFLAEYIDAQDPKKAKITIKPKETTTDYTGSVTSKLTVYDVPKENYINTARQEITGDTLYTGKAIKRDVKLTIGDTELRYNKDYKVQYKNNVNAGTAVMIITGKGQYKGKIVNTFNIGKVDLNKKEAAENIPQHVTIADISAKTFSGREQKPAVTIKTMGNKKLTLNKDYTVTYSNNVHAGTATITIAGIGSNCNGKTSIKFKIEPQQIKKAAVKLIRGKDGAPNTIALTYNKKTLQEYADYIITEYGEMKNKKIPVTIEGRSDFTGNVTKKLSVEAPEDDPDSGSASSSKNINRQNYGSYEGCIVNSYLQKNDDGTFMRVEHIGQQNVCIESYTADQKFIDKKMIKAELPKFGGFYSGKDYYFLVFGQDNPNEDNTVEVIRIVKYDKSWERKGSVGIFGGNTVSPFKNGSLRMVEYENTLYIRTCHQMYRSSDGKQHQANVAISMDIPNMEILEQYLWLSFSTYSSHSFNQFILRDGSDLLAVDHGDAYPRSVALAKYNEKIGTPGILGKSSTRIAALAIGGNFGNPATGVSIGGFEASDTAYLIAGNSVDQTATPYNTGGVRNIYVTSTRKDNFSAAGNTVHWITDHQYIEYTDAKGEQKKTPAASVSTPHLVKISGNEMMVLWTEATIAIENNKPVTASSSQKCVLLNGAGEPVSGVYSFDGPISDCKPIVDNGRLIWYYTNNSAPVFCTLNINDVRNQPK